MPNSEALTSVEAKVTELTRTLRQEFIEGVALLSSEDLSVGATGRQISTADLRQWHEQNEIFAVDYDGRQLYPAFQFGSNGRPLPIIAELLAILKRDADRTDWDNALWFAGGTGWLDGQRPIDLLGSCPESIRRAAEQEALRDTE